MRNRLLGVVLLILCLLGASVWQGTLSGQGTSTVTVVCGGCQGSDFGLPTTTVGIVVFDNQGGNFWFYPINRQQRRPAGGDGSSISPEQQVPAQLIGRLSGVGGPLLLPEQKFP